MQEKLLNYVDYDARNAAKLWCRKYY